METSALLQKVHKRYLLFTYAFCAGRDLYRVIPLPSVRRDSHQIIFRRTGMLRTGMFRSNIGANHVMFYNILDKKHYLGVCVYRYLPFKFAYFVVL